PELEPESDLTSTVDLSAIEVKEGTAIAINKNATTIALINFLINISSFPLIIMYLTCYIYILGL
ncbi:MAG: hypothetical protein LBI03_03070, partial [Clostridiales bacterium]|nr:hypothetical protein [Clostridiales bacterium]